MEQDAPKGLRLVEKTVEVLNLLASEGQFNIAQLAEKTGEPRSSLYRLMGRLEQLQLVESGSQRGYFRLGTHLLLWGAATQSGLDVRDRALPVLKRLREETELTSPLGVVPGETPLRFRTSVPLPAADEARRTIHLSPCAQRPSHSEVARRQIAGSERCRSLGANPLDGPL